MKLTVSVDDGHPNDLKIAEILAKKQIKAIFYIPIKNSEGLKVLNKNQIKLLSKTFQIGCHTLTHVDLTNLSFEETKREMGNAKSELESILGKPVTTFAPPKGYYNSTIIDIAKSLGFKDFRSSRILNYQPPNKSNFVWHPSLHIFPHTRLTDLIHLAKNLDVAGFIKRIQEIQMTHLDYIEKFKKKNVETHFWLHSWEIERYDLWNIIKEI